MPLELAMHHLSMRCGKWPWEWREIDPPIDYVMRALAIEGMEAKWAGKARQLESSGG